MYHYLSHNAKQLSIYLIANQALATVDIFNTLIERLAPMAAMRRSTRTFSIEKVRNLLSSAQEALRDAQAPADYVSARRRFDAAYDVGLSCALALIETNRIEVYGLGHHKEALEYLITPLKLKGETAAAVRVLIRTRNASRYDGATLVNEAMVIRAIHHSRTPDTQGECHHTIFAANSVTNLRNICGK